MTPMLVASYMTLHLAGRRSPQAFLLSPVRTCSGRFAAAGSSPARAAAPLARQSRFRGRCLNEFFAAFAANILLFI